MSVSAKVSITQLAPTAVWCDQVLHNQRSLEPWNKLPSSLFEHGVTRKMRSIQV
jgi:hypothetical protein